MIVLGERKKDGLVVILLEQTGVFLRFVALARVFVLFISGEMLL